MAEVDLSRRGGAVAVVGARRFVRERRQSPRCQACGAWSAEIAALYRHRQRASPRCPGDKPNCIKDLTAAQRQLLAQVLAKFKTSGVSKMCSDAAALIRRAFNGSGANMYAGDGTIHDDPNDPHRMQAYPDIRNGVLIEFSLHIDEDYLQDVSNGVRLLSDAANLLLHEGMHGVINPATNSGYGHTGYTGEPYPAPFSTVHTGSLQCVR